MKKVLGTLFLIMILVSCSSLKEVPEQSEPEDYATTLRNAALNGQEDEMKYFLETTVFCAGSFTHSNPQDALFVYKEFLKANNISEEDRKKEIDFLSRCAEIPPLDARQFCEKYGLLYEYEDIKNEPYYVWQLAEEASREGGRFGSPDPLLVLQLIIAGGQVHMEFEYAFNDFYEYYKNNEVHEFKIDNYVTSGYGINFCTVRRQGGIDESIDGRVNNLKMSLRVEDRELFQQAIQAYFAFVDTKIWNEEGHDGSGWLTWAYDSANGQKEELLDYLERLPASPTISSDAAELSDLILQLDELKEQRNALIGDGRIHGRHFTITLDDILETDALWQTYIDSMIAFIDRQYGSETSLEMTGWIYQNRIEDIQNVIVLYRDYQ